MMTNRFSRSTWAFAAASSVALVGMLLHGCSDQSCGRDGTTNFSVPKSRLPFLDGVEADGDCVVYAPAEDCDAGRCATTGDGLSVLFLVVGLAHGTCTVTASFTDGVEPLTHRYKFAGPIDDCCNEICAWH